MIHVELLEESSEKLLEIVLPYSILLSEIVVEMPRDKSFTTANIGVVEREVQYPNIWKQVWVRFDHFSLKVNTLMTKLFQNQTLFYGNVPQDSSLLRRRISVVPTMADRILINMTRSSPSVLLKLDLYGMSNEKAYSANPILDPKEYLDCK